METPETPLTPSQQRVKELVEQLGQDHHGVDCQALQDELRGALMGACAKEIFGDQRETLLEQVNKINEADPVGANRTSHLVSRVLLMQLDAFTGRKIADATQSLRAGAEAAA